MQIVTSWMEQGRQEAQMEIAQRMLAEKLPVETVARITGFSIEQIQQLQTVASQNPPA
jgi:predicted transposase/invertase (TIGR01784 family)